MLKSNQLKIITSLRVTLARLDGIPTLAHGNEETRNGGLINITMAV